MSEGKSNDDDTDGKKMFNSSSSLIMNQFLAGGVSGLLSRAATHPVDTIKSQMQVSNLVVTRRSTERSGCDSTSHRRPILTSARLLNAKHAIQNLYRGFGAAALGAPMASGMYFLGYETTKKTLKKIRRERRREGAFNDDDHEEEEEDNKTTIYMIDNIITGVGAQAFAGIAYTPVDVVKERMQVSSVLPTNLKTNNGVDYRNAFDALKTIVKNEGIKNGLMRGYWAQNFVWWPWSACYFVAYEKGLEIFRRNNNDNKSSLRVDDNGGVFGGDAERSNFESSSSSSSSVKSSSSFYREGGWYENNISPHAVSAFAAATCATILTHPLDLCKTRVQTMTNNNNNNNNKKVMTLRTVFKDVVRKEGVLALYRGVFARVLSVAPGSAISFYAYESIRKSGALRLEEED
ncbi:mitochondrial carrier family [Bathycoccus prasinos]|uniref:Mitochondrial carrier family n=1 Tax=Bathycoccus prasinos TaxID=41875 RepID=K8EPB7_9CHLO|nr:mitochondrial carrier family [Bathycoccus prasinos]CCO19794.1 mitochondrial carrier family [Bathycoccus prasinos]|eukprot:XP_007509337.1 mitochondrial carrier family [Bathycoccus prasinos]